LTFEIDPMSSTFALSILLASSTVGFGDHHLRRVEAISARDRFDPEVARDLAILRASPRWRARDDAAHRLGKVSWRKHPQILPALVAALTCDPEEEVREEAAESLGKLAPCIAEVHEGLATAARRDPDGAVRRQAKKALKSLGTFCEDPCGACDPGLVIERRAIDSEPVFVDLPMDAFPVPADELPPGTIVVPPADLPAPLPGSSPFGEASSRNRNSTARVAANNLLVRRRPPPSRVLDTRK